MKDTYSNDLKVTAYWDRKLVPADKNCERNLLLNIEAPRDKIKKSNRTPLSIALVIDRSGSMRGMQIEAAKTAAQEVVESLNEHDRVSIVTFDQEVETLVESTSMTTRGKRIAVEKISGIFSRGMTNLSAGWFEGARCVATSLHGMEHADGRVIVLSDGHANEGICDTEELHKHAAELAQRGIKTSAVGIGAGYSPLQLDALVEGGQGRLHDAETCEDIVNVVNGELLELKRITAADVSVAIETPVGVSMETMSRSRIEHASGFQTLKIGDLGEGKKRSIAIKVMVPSTPSGTKLPFKITADWTDMTDSAVQKRETTNTLLEVVPRGEAMTEIADTEILGAFATIWETGLVYQSLIHNERHDYTAATSVFDSNRDYFEGLVSELDDSNERLGRFIRATDRVKNRWDGRSKRQVFARSKKSMLMEKDHRSDGDMSWDKFIDR